MTARMTKQYTIQERFITDFMQTVQYNYNLNHVFMKSADVHKKDQFGNTALYWAIYHHNMYNVKLLLYFGCTLDVSQNLKAPFFAINCNNLEFIVYLVEKELDLFMEYEGETLLQYAECYGSKEIKEYFKKNNLKRN